MDASSPSGALRLNIAALILRAAGLSVEGERLALGGGQIGTHVRIEADHALGKPVIRKIVDILVNQLAALRAG